MKQTISNNIITPLLTRMGTATTVWLVGKGLEQPDAQNIVLGVTLIAGVAFDLVLRRVLK